MLKMTWRNLFARKVRLALSAFAVVLGVAFVAGSFIFTDAMGDAFDGIIEGSTSDVEIAYKGANNFESQQDLRTIPASVVNRLDQLPEVESVHPSIQLQSVYVIGRDHKVVGGNGPPGLAFNYTGGTSIAGKPIITLTAGAFPARPGQVALDVDTARKAGYGVGDTLTLVTPGDPPTVKAEVVGLVEFGSGGLNGATLSLLDLGFLQDSFYQGRNVFTAVSLNAAPGVSQTQLAAAAQKVLPRDVVATTGDALVKRNKATLDEILGFLNTFLLVFAGVSLVVGTFLIINTFSILVAQRSRELALLRALGASRRQVNLSVLVEAVVVGVFGSTVGLLAGYLLARGLQVLFGAVGFDLSRASFPINLRTVVASYAVGVVVTVVAAYLPARRAATIPPVAALRDDVAMPEASLHRRVLVGFGLIVLGVVGMVVGFAKTGKPRAVPDRSGHAGDPRRRLAAQPLGRPAADPDLRAGLPPRLRHRRHARRPELPAQPEAYGGHRQRPDDRSDPGLADVDPRPVRDGERGRVGEAQPHVAVRGLQRGGHAVLDERRARDPQGRRGAQRRGAPHRGR